MKKIFFAFFNYRLFKDFTDTSILKQYLTLEQPHEEVVFLIFLYEVYFVSLPLLFLCYFVVLYLFV